MGPSYPLMLWPCDHPRRIGARIYAAMRTDCPCCLFWREVVYRAVVLALLGLIVYGVFHGH